MAVVMANYTNDKSVRIRYNQEWMGFPAGYETSVWEHVANHLSERGVATILDSEQEEVEPSEIIQSKAFRRPTKDKMMREAPNTK